MEDTKPAKLVCHYLLFSLGGFGLLGLVVNGYTLWAHYRAASGVGGWGVPGLELVLWFCLGVVILTLFTAFGLFLSRLRCASFAIMIGGAFYVLLNLATLAYADKVRMAGFERLAEESRPLVAAIEAYVAQHGVPPEGLQAIDTSGIPAERLASIRYLTGYQSQQHFHGNPWILALDAPTGPFRWDQFLYYPLQNYPKLGHDGWLEEINGWAYVHQ